MKNSEMPAYPTEIGMPMDDSSNPAIKPIPVSGLTKLEYFAAKAMQGLCANNSGDPMTCVNISITIAKATLKALEEET